MSKVYILPNLRKGLAKHIDGQSPDGLRVSFTVRANLYGDKVGAEEGAAEEQIKEEVQQFLLAGPVDVRTVNEAAISEIVPEDKSEGYSNGYMPYIEFYEEDFPWRYTPEASSEKLRPWLMLLACKDDEFTLEKDNHGFRRVTVNLKGCKGFYPDQNDFYKLAHVQVTAPDTVEDDDPDYDKVAAYVVENPDDGISRLFCHRELEEKQHYTMFLVPAFELGRRAGVGESLEGASLNQLSWTDDSAAVKFPVYYQWSFKTGSVAFLELAWRQNFILPEEFKALPDGLKADIQETGLKQYREFIPQEDKILIDIPVALVKKDFNEDNLAEEVAKVKMGDNQTGEKVVHMTDELKSLLELNPVFSENAGLSEEEDPWIVPPVYGARHILATKEDLDDKKKFLSKLNLRFRNRAAAGMGVSVVKRNQEVFTNRAWGMIEEINAQNQRIREYYEAAKANGASSKKATSLQYYTFQPHAAGLQADAAIRVANAQSSADVNAVDMAMDVALDNLAVRSSVLQPFRRANGITMKELEIIADPRYWEGHWAEITRNSYDYRLLTGSIPFFEGNYDERFRFLANTFTVGYHPVIQDSQNQLLIPQYSVSGSFYDFYSKGEPRMLPDPVKNYPAVKNIGHYLDFFRSEDQNKYHRLDYILGDFPRLKQEYEEKWAENISVYESTYIIFSELYWRCLPPKGYVYDENHSLVGYAVYLKHSKVPGSQEEDSKSIFSKYPDGVRLPYKNSNVWGKEFSLYILPAEKFNDIQKSSLVYRRTTNYGEFGYPLVRNSDGYFTPADVDKDGKVTECPLDQDLSVWTHHTINWDGYSFFPLVYNPVTSGRLFKVLKSATECNMGDGSVLLPSNGHQVSCFDRGSDNTSAVVHTIWLSLLKNNGKNVVAAEMMYYFKGDNCPCYTFILDIDARPDEGTSPLCSIASNGSVKVNLFVFKRILEKAVEMGEWLENIMWFPNRVELTEESLKKIKKVTADEIGMVETKIEGMNEYYDVVIDAALAFHNQLEPFKLVPPLTDEPEAELIPEEKLIDADEENRKRLQGIVDEFAERGMTLDLSISNFDGKYPIMAYPIFPDPTSFYLRELSERFILPSVDQLKMNSISCFVTNPLFEEAFLAGMNTEMGRELLWREYPTDERGSYFRKFWDQVHLPSDFSRGYFDVKYLHNWTRPLGANHEEGKGQLLVFVIKSELMMMYPQTGITLSKKEDGKLKSFLAPTMTGWLSDDTYMAGFDISKLSDKKGVFLTFTETDKSQRFSRTPISSMEENSSSLFAVNRKNDGSVWGIGVAPEDLVVNTLHFEDEDEDDTGGLLWQQGHLDPRPNTDIGHIDPEEHIDPHFRR